jgi:hypothetical protein
MIVLVDGEDEGGAFVFISFLRIEKRDTKKTMQARRQRKEIDSTPP